MSTLLHEFTSPQEETLSSRSPDRKGNFYNPDKNVKYFFFAVCPHDKNLFCVFVHEESGQELEF